MADVKNYMVGNDQNTIDQIDQFSKSPAYVDSKIRIMPDAHAGKGAVIGSTMTFTDKIVPGTVGVDIACRVSGFPLGDKVKDIDFDILDEVCRTQVPTGFSVRNVEHAFSLAFPYAKLHCWNKLRNHDRLRKSMGTLGGGNHYIEVDQAADGTYWFVIHCGSRNLGKQIAEFYQNLAIVRRDERIAAYQQAKSHELDYLRKIGRIDLIQTVIDYWNGRINQEPVDDLCYITDEDMTNYLEDMELCNEFSFLSHLAIYDQVAKLMGWENQIIPVTCIHNYVDVKHGLIRKGAIEGYRDQFGLIPLNMRDGILLVQALGNEDWNCSLPHGAGRCMSRGEARNTLTLDDFKQAMEGIATSSVVDATIDEAPMAYKDAAAIIAAIQPNARIVDHMLPVYNFKAC